MVYADLSQSFVMWDLVENKQLTAKQSIAFGIVRTKSPQWTLDGSKVIFAAPNQSLEYMNDELFAIDQHGNMEKLTDMASIFSTVSINRYSWSPDNHYIAILFSEDNNENGSVEQLAVLDVYSHVLSIYCIEGDNSLTTNFDYRRNPKGVIDGNVYKGVVWSPDSHQLIIENRFLENSSRIILIDIDKQEAYEILTNVNYQPVGWAAH